MEIYYILSAQNIQTIIEGVLKATAEKPPAPSLQPASPTTGFATGSRARAFIVQLTILSISCPFASTMLTATGTPPSRRWVAQDMHGS